MIPGPPKLESRLFVFDSEPSKRALQTCVRQRVEVDSLSTEYRKGGDV